MCFCVLGPQLASCDWSLVIQQPGSVSLGFSRAYKPQSRATGQILSFTSQKCVLPFPISLLRTHFLHRLLALEMRALWVSPPPPAPQSPGNAYPRFWLEMDTSLGNVLFQSPCTLFPVWPLSSVSHILRSILFANTLIEVYLAVFFLRTDLNLFI